MKKKWVIVFLAVLSTGLMAGCESGNGKIVSQERALTGFDGISIANSSDVTVYPSMNYRVIVTTEENIQSNIVTEVRSNVLYIENKGKFSTKELKIDVYLPELKAISLKGSGDAKIINGNISNFDINISGTGDLDAQNFQVENANITITGPGDSKIWVTETLTGTISGSGDVRYKGNPRVNVKVTGAGTIMSF